jgi:hypothetical protein
MRRSFFAALIALAIATFGSLPTLAVTTESSKPFTRPYVAAFEPQFRGAFPFVGTMELTFNNGILSGSYRDESIKPGAPFSNGRIAHVAGGVSGNNIHFTIGGSFSVKGTIAANGAISGTAQYRGHLYNFYAEVGKPGKPG